MKIKVFFQGLKNLLIILALCFILINAFKKLLEDLFLDSSQILMTINTKC